MVADAPPPTAPKRADPARDDQAGKTGRSKGQDLKELTGLSYVGLFFGIAVAVGAWLGSLADDRWDTDPWGITIGAILGSISGFRELYRVAMKASRDMDAQ